MEPFARAVRKSFGLNRLCSGGLFLEAARYCACASRTAGISLILRKTGAHRAPLQETPLQRISNSPETVTSARSSGKSTVVLAYS